MTGKAARDGAIGHWLRKSDEALASAQSELRAGRLEFAVNRAYYASFYAASAVLFAQGRHFVKHSGVRAALHQSLVKPGQLAPRFGRIFDRLFDARQSADYLVLAVIAPDQAAELAGEAAEFVAAMRALMGPTAP